MSLRLILAWLLLMLPLQRERATLRVLYVSPATAIAPTDPFTVTFDRPVTGSLGGVIDPATVARLEPPRPARMDWRDPTTLRIVPQDPWTMGQVVTLVIDTTLVSMDGSRLAAPERILIRVRGPVRRATQPPLRADSAITLPPNGILRALYSSVIDTAEFNRVARVEFAASGECAAGTIALRVTQRPLADNDAWHARWAPGENPVARLLARHVEFAPNSRLPDGCDGTFVVPALDSTDATEVRYPVRSAEPFAIQEVVCAAPADCASSDMLTVVFSVPVRSDRVRDALHVNGATPDFPLGPQVVSAINIRRSIVPGSTHRVTVDSMLADVAGRRLTGLREVTIEAGDRKPRLSHASGFLALSHDAAPLLRVSHLNVDSAELHVVPLALSAMIAPTSGDLRRIAWDGPEATRRMVALGGARNEVHESNVAIPELSAGESPTVLAIRLHLKRGASGLRPTSIRSPVGSFQSSTPDSMTTAPVVLQRSDLAVVARVDETSGAVLVTDVRTGRPLGGADVQLRDSSGAMVARGRSNSSGVALLTGGDPATWSGSVYGPRQARLVDVARGRDRIVMPVTFTTRDPFDGGWANPVYLMDSNQPSRGRRTVLITDRDRYRPGDMVYLSAIARDGRVNRLRPPGVDERLRWVVSSVFSGSPETVHQRIAQFTAFGTSSDSFRVPTRAPLGSYVATLQRELRSGWVTVGSAGFRVLEYRTPEFVVAIKPDTTPRFAGEPLPFDVSARYLFEAPMRSATLRWNANFRQVWVGELKVRGLRAGFHFGDHPALWETVPWRPPTAQVSGTDTLDGRGARTVAPRNPLNAPGSYIASFSAAIEDVSRQVVTETQKRAIYGSSFFLSVRDMTRSPWRVNRPVLFDVMAVRPDGRGAAGETIAVRILRGRWVQNGPGGARRLVSDSITGWSVTSADTAIRIAFTPTEDAPYTIQLASTDSMARPVETRVRRQASGSAPSITPAASGRQLAVVTDSFHHALNTPAMVRFVSPFDSAVAWVTVEREELLQQFTRLVRRGPNEIPVLVRPDMAPEAVVGVVLVNQAQLQASDSVQHRVRHGMVRVKVDSTLKRLSVTVAPEAPEVAPGTNTRVRLRVVDGNGRGVASAVTVWAVDEGVLSLGAFKRPEPVPALQNLTRRWLSVSSTVPSSAPLFGDRAPAIDLRRRHTVVESRMARIALSSARAETMRLSEVVSVTQPVVPRMDFLPTAFFRGMVVTGRDGRATVSVKLPDNVTTWRLFAVAVDRSDRSGSAESTFVATKPLVVRAALPRFVRPGDSLFAGAVIGTRDGQPRSVSVAASGTGLQLLGTSRASWSLGSSSIESRFTWRAIDSDSAAVTLTATSSAEQDAVRVAIPVKPDRFPTTRASSGVVRDTATVRIALPRDTDLRRARLTIRAGTTPLPLLNEARLFVMAYPYECTEQLVASGRVLIATMALHRAGLPVTFDSLRARRDLQSVVDRLATRQRTDGAFGYWSGDSWTTPWLSAMVGQLMADASDAGAVVVPRVRDRLITWMQKSLDSLPVLPDTTFGTRIDRRQAAEVHLGNRLAAAAYLRRVGAARAIEEAELLQREALLAWEDRVLLASILHSAGRTGEASASLERAWQGVGMVGTRADLPDSIMGRGLFRSRVRPAARLIEATVAIDPSHPRLGALMERLVRRTSAVGMWNTQDYATAAEAVAAYTHLLPRGQAALTAQMIRPGDGPSVVTLRTDRGAAVDTTIALAGLVESSGDSLVANVRLSASNGPMFYSLTTEHVSVQPDTRPLASGIVVERWYERFDNGEPVTDVQEGDLVRVRVRVTVPSDRELVAVEDPLPAGLEAIDLTLRTSRTLGPFSNADGQQARLNRDREALAGGVIGSWDNGWWSPWEHSEKRDDRVTWFARALPTGTYLATYVARATTSGRFIRPPARAEEMYNASVSGRSEGGTFSIANRR